MRPREKFLNNRLWFAVTNNYRDGKTDAHKYIPYTDYRPISNMASLAFTKGNALPSDECERNIKEKRSQDPFPDPRREALWLRFSRRHSIPRAKCVSSAMLSAIAWQSDFRFYRFRSFWKCYKKQSLCMKFELWIFCQSHAQFSYYMKWKMQSLVGDSIIFKSDVKRKWRGRKREKMTNTTFENMEKKDYCNGTR